MTSPLPLYRVIFDLRAWRELMALPDDLQHRIFDAIDKLEVNPRPSGCKKLKGSRDYRIRVGDYRIIYDIQDNILVVEVIQVGKRDHIYDSR